MSQIPANAPQFELRFNPRKSVSAAQSEVNPFGNDGLDLGSSRVKSHGDLMPCLKGGSTDVQSQGDFPPGCLFGNATDVTSNGHRTDAPCISAGSTDVTSNGHRTDAPCISAGSTDVRSQGDVGIGCLFGNGSDVKSGWNLA